MNNKNKNIIIIILIVIIVVLSGFIICDKVLNKAKDNDIIDNDKLPNKNVEEVLLNGDVFHDILNEEQQGTVDMSKNFKEVTYTINNVPVTYNCSSYEEREPSRCIKATVKINNHILTIDNESLGCGHNDEIIYTNNYFIYQRIGQCVGTGIIEIYDKNHNLLVSIDNVNDSYQDEQGKIIYDVFKLQNNKLYFASFDKGVYNGGVPQKTYYSYIDLTDSNYKINKIK